MLSLAFLDAGSEKAGFYSTSNAWSLTNCTWRICGYTCNSIEYEILFYSPVSELLEPFSLFVTKDLHNFYEPVYTIYSFFYLITVCLIIQNSCISHSQTTVHTSDRVFKDFEHSTARICTDRHCKFWSNRMSDSSGDVHESEDEHIGERNSLAVHVGKIAVWPEVKWQGCPVCGWFDSGFRSAGFWSAKPDMTGCLTERMIDGDKQTLIYKPNEPSRALVSEHAKKMHQSGD